MFSSFSSAGPNDLFDPACLQATPGRSTWIATPTSFHAIIVDLLYSSSALTWRPDTIVLRCNTWKVFFFHCFLPLNVVAQTVRNNGGRSSKCITRSWWPSLQPSSNEWRYPQNNHNSRLRKNQKRWIERPGRRLAGAQAATMRDGEWWPLIIRAGHSRDEKEEPHQHEREREKGWKKSDIKRQRRAATKARWSINKSTQFFTT